MTSSTATAEVATTSFADFNFSSSIVGALESSGFVTPTPIQAKAIPVALTGRDLIGLAQTGTGKTAAFVLPILQHLLNRKVKGIRALVLAPTRELADQIDQVVQDFSAGSGLRSAVIYGGVSHGRQRDQLQRKPEIVVACPGRLLDHMQEGTIKLDGIEFLVLDEADRMFDMGFLPVVRRIVKSIPRERQTMLFSATMPPEIQKLTAELLVDPEIVRVRAEVPVATLEHSILSMGEKQKGEALKAWLTLNPEAVAVVFTKMKHTAKRLATKLSAVGLPATALHGNLSQGQRQRALAGFKDGSFKIMIATDIAARGIDVDGVTHVINYDMADTLESYIHRAGRAGRNSRSGTAITFVTPEDTFLVRSIEKWLKAPLSRLTMDIPAPSPESDESMSRGPRERRAGGDRGRSRGDRPSQPRQNREGGSRQRRHGGGSGPHARSSGGQRRDGGMQQSGGQREVSNSREVNGNREGANRSRPVDSLSGGSNSNSGGRSFGNRNRGRQSSSGDRRRSF